MYPVLFKIGSVTIYSYGFAVAVAVAIVFLLASRWAPKAGLPVAMTLDALFVLFVSGVAGARLWYVLQHWSDYSGNLVSIIWIQEGGLVWYGGFLVAFSCGMIFAKLKKLYFLQWADFIAPLLALAHSIGRVGCYLNGCCYGRFFGIPTQLAEAGALIALSAALFQKGKQKRFHGQVICLYAILYSAARFVIEFSRLDQTRVYQLSLAQWTSIAIFLIAVILYQWLSRSPKRVMSKI